MSDLGVWVVWHTDWHAFVDGIFDSEIEARRFADSDHYKYMSCEVEFFPFGAWEPFGPEVSVSGSERTT